MTMKILEPIPTGVYGKLLVDEQGAVFMREGNPFRLDPCSLPVEQLGLKAGDTLTGWLQCYHGWTVQPEGLVDRWLASKGDGLHERLAGGKVRVVFRVDDFETLDRRDAASMTLQERKTFLDGRLEDREPLQKNPYLLLAEEQAETLIASQPAGLEWLVRNAAEPGCRESGDALNRPTSEFEEPEDDRKIYGKGLDLAVAGGWLDLAAVEQCVRSTERQIQLKDLQLREAEEEREQLLRTRESEARLHRAGERYLELLRERGERCIRAAGGGDDVEERVQFFLALFDAAELDVEALERQTEKLQRELEQLYPTQPVARSSGLDLPKPSLLQRWEEFQVRSVK